MKENEIFVSVIMPCYNTNSDYLNEAIQSILHQSHSNFELIIIDDGSKDSVESFVSRYKDNRIRVITNSKNKGITACLNIGLNESKGTYAFRMDSDDISMPNRLSSMIHFMEKNKEIDIAGSAVQYFGSKFGWRSLPKTNAEIRAYMLLACPFVHPTVVLRKRYIDESNFRYYEFRYAEDYYTWFKCSLADTCFANSTETLLKYRIHPDQITAASSLQNVEIELLSTMMAELKIDTNHRHRLYCNFMFKHLCRNVHEAKKIHSLAEDIIKCLQDKSFCDWQLYVKYYNKKARKTFIKGLTQIGWIENLKIYNAVRIKQVL